MTRLPKLRRGTWLAALIGVTLACGRGTGVTEVPATTAPAATTAAPMAAPTDTAAPAGTPATEAPLATATPLPVEDPAPDLSALAGTVAQDVTYCTSAEGVELKMDVYYPDSLAEPVPVVVFIHGGGWASGDKGQGKPIYTGLVDLDFLVVSLNYRHAPEFPYPAQVQDVRCAVRHLRANAATYGLDPARIGSMGTSAGGHLASLLGVADAVEGWDVGPDLEQPSKVQAVASMYGSHDLTLPSNGLSREGEQVFGPIEASNPVLVEASPVTYVTPDDAPFLLIHGALDNFVPPNNSEVMYNRLTAVGVPAELIVVEGGRHAFMGDSYPVQPSRPELVASIGAFFSEYLK